VTAEDQQRADERIPLLLQCPAALHFISFEPLLSRVMIPPEHLDRLGWTIAGAETGPRKRPMLQRWARDLRGQCAAAGVPFFFKRDSTGSRLLDGQLHEEFPCLT